MKLRSLKIALVFLFLTGYLAPSHAQDTGTEPIEAVPEFKPYMLDHPFEGCPGGSKCTKETGIQRKKWSDLLKLKRNRLKSLETYRQKVGLPLATWSFPVTNIPTGLALWNSPCPDHNLENDKILLAEFVASDFKKLEQLKNIIIRKTLLKTADKIVAYPSIRDESPLYISQQRLVYNLDLDGDYYGISIGSDGSVKVVDPVMPSNFPENVSCPPEMETSFKELKSPNNLYKATTCKSLWDLEAKAYRTVAMGWSCS